VQKGVNRRQEGPNMARKETLASSEGLDPEFIQIFNALAHAGRVAGNHENAREGGQENDKDSGNELKNLLKIKDFKRYTLRKRTENELVLRARKCQ
jgi:hypothetical protein